MKHYFRCVLRSVLWWLYCIKSLQPNFTEHAIRSGNLLLTLEESHLKEMGVVKVGHRLELMEAIHGLQREAGLVNKCKFINLPQLLMEWVDRKGGRNVYRHYFVRTGMGQYQNWSWLCSNLGVIIVWWLVVRLAKLVVWYVCVGSWRLWWFGYLVVCTWSCSLTCQKLGKYLQFASHMQACGCSYWSCCVSCGLIVIVILLSSLSLSHTHTHTHSLTHSLTLPLTPSPFSLFLAWKRSVMNYRSGFIQRELFS